MSKRNLEDYQLPMDKCIANTGEINSYCLKFKEKSDQKFSDLAVEYTVCTQCFFYLGTKGHK